MSRRRNPDDWRREVLRSYKINDSVRVLLLYLADHMRQDRTVSVKRDTIAKALGRTERRVSARIAEAHKAGFLSTVAPGYRGHVAVYQGLFPDAESGTATSTLSGPRSVPLSPHERGTHGEPTTTTADPSVSPYRRDVGSDEGAEDHGVRVDLTACEFHVWQSCPTDCRNYSRRTA